MKIDAKTRKRLELYILMEGLGYLSMSMMRDLIKGLASNRNVHSSVVMAEFTHMKGAIDIRSSGLAIEAVYFDQIESIIMCDLLDEAVAK